jgi:hypothetical protein
LTFDSNGKQAKNANFRCFCRQRRQGRIFEPDEAEDLVLNFVPAMRNEKRQIIRVQLRIIGKKETRS